MFDFKPKKKPKKKGRRRVTPHFDKKNIDILDFDIDIPEPKKNSKTSIWNYMCYLLLTI